MCVWVVCHLVLSAGERVGQGKRGIGYQSESREAERVVRWAAEADSRALHPGRGSAVPWTW